MLSLNSNQLTLIPGIGKVFAQDFQRIGITRIDQLRNQNPEHLYESLVKANANEDHTTSKNYLYVLRMAVYFSNGGRDPEKLRWNYWKQD